MGRYPNVAVPKTIAEKFLWRKIFDRNPLFAEISDKLKAKEFAAGRCPDVLIPKVLWIGKDFSDIPDILFQRQAVLKSNHASGQIIFLEGNLNRRIELKTQTNAWLSKPYGQKNGEWGYRNIERKIFIEELILGAKGEPLEDYNVYVMDGKVQHSECLRDSYGRNPTTSRYDRDGNQIEKQYSPKFTTVFIAPPPQYDKIVNISERLGAGFDFIRCDLYLCGGVIYFCEMTVYPIAGYPTYTKKLEELYNCYWDLRKSWFLTTPQSGWRGIYAKWLKMRLDADHMGIALQPTQ